MLQPMVRKLLDRQLAMFEKGRPLHRMRPLVAAVDTFLFEAPHSTKGPPHIRDAVDLKRWMVLVVISLGLCTLMAIWNTGVQKFVYESGNYQLMNSYLSGSGSLAGYFEFCFSEGRWLTILGDGLIAFLPVVLVSYLVGGLWEGLFAVVRGHEIAEGFLVTGILYALILPPTIPLWMVAIGVSFGVVVGKELFGGTGMNILNPALTSRIFLFFAFPQKMTGPVWAGTNPTTTANSLKKMNVEAGLSSWDGYTQASECAKFNVGNEVRRVHIDAIATNTLGTDVPTIDVIDTQFQKWNVLGSHDAQLGSLSGDQMHDFVTSGLDIGGLGLPPDSYDAAYQFAGLREGVGINSDWNLFLGNKLGSMGETSILFCLLGAFLLIWTGIAAWRTMLAVGLGAYITALIFEWTSRTLGVDGGAWNPARFAFPAYKHFLIGSLVFGLIFMATEPVTSPAMSKAKWIYGFLIGALVILIRVINPAYPEGVMLAILFGNVFAPVFDTYAMRVYRRVRRVKAKTA
jgi:Na+-transporting NADH:ubiquinone oxidoreductase subunit B